MNLAIENKIYSYLIALGYKNKDMILTENTYADEISKLKILNLL